MQTVSCPVCCVDDRWSIRHLDGVAGRVPDVVLAECSGCGIVRTAFDLPRPELESYSKKFLAMVERDYVERGDATMRRIFDERADALGTRASGRLLDVGSERGYFLATMRARGWTVEGIEPHVPFADFARDSFKVPVQTTTLEDARFDEGFDLITLWHVLEHLDDPRAALKKCLSLLRPGGTLFFEMPNLDSLGARLCGAYWLGLRDPTHRWGFRPDAVARMARAAGFADSEVKASWTAAGWYGIKRSLKNSITQRDHWQGRVENRRTPASWWREVLASLAGFYPVPVTLALLGGWLGQGEVLRAWCRRPVESAQ